MYSCPVASMVGNFTSVVDLNKMLSVLFFVYALYCFGVLFEKLIQIKYIVYACSVPSMIQGFTSAVDSYSGDSEMFCYGA